uniref:Centrosomal protein POC5 n=1 Tax=Hydra vulgaris TaxID=6087 RepID=T2M9G4_HYDVU
MSIVSKSDSIPDFTEEISRGSSVSTGFVNEYEEILKYAIVTPKMQGTQNFYINKPDLEIKEPSISTSKNDNINSKSQHEMIQSSDVKPKNTLSKKSLDAKDKSDNLERCSGLRSSALDSLLEYSTTPVNNSSTNKLKVESKLNTGLVAMSPEIEAMVSAQNGESDLVRMDRNMDTWCLQLKRNVLGELADMKLMHIQQQEQMEQDLKNKFSIEIMRHDHELDSMRELLFTFEQNSKQKDEVIANLSEALNKQKERCDKIRLFSMWRLKYNDEKRLAFCSKIADKYYKKVLLSTVWSAWRGIISQKWKQRVEKACQIKSQEVCLKLSEDYEQKLQSLHQELIKARDEISKMHSERECYEEAMKKAFMRGVCALNMEAMSIFKGEPDSNDMYRRSHVPCSSNPISSCKSENEKIEKIVNFTQVNENLKKNENTPSIISTTSISKPFNVKLTATKSCSKASKPVTGRNPITSVKIERHVPIIDSYPYNTKSNVETLSKRKHCSISCAKVAN